MKKFLFLFILTIILLNLSSKELPKPKIEFNPREYVCYKTSKALNLDGKLDEEDWQKAEWTEKFIDIEGIKIPKYETKVKMLWDENYFYFAAKMEEPHIWAKLKERDSVIFYDNDFEIFIDPDGDTHNYYELEFNAFETEWDLLLLHPYREDGQVAIDSWDIQGLITKVNINGSLNNPTDIDSSWTAEIAIPWKVLEECSDNPAPPQDKDQWRVNFSRVQWETKIEDNDYKKLDKPPYNWVWSPQGLIAMHYPEMWGFVQFSTKNVGENSVDFNFNKTESIKWDLRKIYYAQRDYKFQRNTFSSNLKDLKLLNLKKKYEDIKIHKTKNSFQAYIESKGKTIYINHQGHTWIEK